MHTYVDTQRDRQMSWLVSGDERESALAAGGH